MAMATASSSSTLAVILQTSSSRHSPQLPSEEALSSRSTGVRSCTLSDKGKLLQVQANSRHSGQYLPLCRFQSGCFREGKPRINSPFCTPMVGPFRVASSPSARRGSLLAYGETTPALFNREIAATSVRSESDNARTKAMNVSVSEKDSLVQSETAPAAFPSPVRRSQILRSSAAGLLFLLFLEGGTDGLEAAKEAIENLVQQGEQEVVTQAQELAAEVNAGATAIQETIADVRSEAQGSSKETGEASPKEKVAEVPSSRQTETKAQEGEQAAEALPEQTAPPGTTDSKTVSAEATESSGVVPESPAEIKETPAAEAKDVSAERETASTEVSKPTPPKEQAIEPAKTPAPVEKMEARKETAPVEKVEVQKETAPVEKVEAQKETAPVEKVKVQKETPPVEKVDVQIETAPKDKVEVQQKTAAPSATAPTLAKEAEGTITSGKEDKAVPNEKLSKAPVEATPKAAKEASTRTPSPSEAESKQVTAKEVPVEEAPAKDRGREGAPPPGPSEETRVRVRARSGGEKEEAGGALESLIGFLISNRDARGAAAAEGVAFLGGSNLLKLTLTSIGAIGFSFLWLTELEKTMAMKRELSGVESEGEQKKLRLVEMRKLVREREALARGDTPDQAKAAAAAWTEPPPPKKKAVDASCESLLSELESQKQTFATLRERVQTLREDLQNGNTETIALANQLVGVATSASQLVQYASSMDKRVRELERLEEVKEQQLDKQTEEMTALERELEGLKRKLDSLFEVKLSLNYSYEPQQSLGSLQGGSGSKAEELTSVQSQLATMKAKAKETASQLDLLRQTLEKRQSEERGYAQEVAQMADEVRDMKATVKKLTGGAKELEYLEGRMTELAEELMRSEMEESKRREGK
eukprot:TRINITY_DN22800_c0_g1_i1.p1 TRINITY_DN22800_c0_g1~~TRINITY_DN22800_c0_g1_i1.p1  ORF type:complete len:875 (+),score=208.20 TRINITY_DN22800_c0_g1_i1:426-3050(+)